jgi:hypothetical protein
VVENTVHLRYEAASLGNQFPDILKEKSVFTFVGLEVQREQKALHSFKTSGTDYVMMQPQIQEKNPVYKFVSN